jgi:alanyl-tRNA synthetase
VGSTRLYYDDSYTTRFDARLADAVTEAGRTRVELDSTYFYPESGGQEADRGSIGGARVVDVQAGDDGRVWHTLAEGDAAPGEASAAEVDWTRRFENMQQHTGQHILSAAFERELNAATLSSHLGEERGSIELTLGEADWKLVDRIEAVSNRIVWEDRELKLHWTDEEGVNRFALRKPPKASGRIRVVEIPDWDLSACGGTHTRRTGEVGVIKIVRWEKVRGNLRFEFLCGARALRDHAWRLEALVESAKRRTLKDRDLLETLERAAAERDELKKRLADLTAKALAAEAKERVGNPPAGVADFAAARSREDTRTFALKCLEAGAPWVAIGAGAPEPCLIVARAKSGSGDLKALLPELLARAGGKGGGAPDFLQLSCADAAKAEAAWRWAGEAVKAAVGR